MPQIVTFLQSIALFDGINDSDLLQISADFRRRTYKSRQHIFYEGDYGQDMYLLESGQIQIFVNGLDGSEVSVTMLGNSGQIFGELSVLDRKPRSASAKALRNTVVYSLNREQFRHHVSDYPQVAFNFMEFLSRRVRYNTRQVQNLASSDVSRRLATKLLEMSNTHGVTQDDEAILIDIVLSDSHIASLIGTSRETVNRMLKAYRDVGLTSRQGRQLVILDPIALAQIIGQR